MNIFDNKNEFQVVIDMPEGTTLEKTQAVTKDIAGYISQQPLVENYQSYIGTSAPISFNGLVRHYDLRRGDNVADIQVNLVNKENRSIQSHDIAKAMREPIQAIAKKYNANAKMVEVPPGPPVLSTLVAEIYGPDYNEQIKIAQQLKDRFTKTTDVVDADWMVEADQPEYHIEVDKENSKKDIGKLDIEIPVMSPRIQREYRNLAELDVSTFGNVKVEVKTFTDEEKREIVFKDVVDEKTHHTTVLTGDIEPDYQSVIGFFAQAVMRDLRLFGCYDILFGKVKEFVQNNMFDQAVDLSDLNTLRNLSEVEYIRLVKDSFKKAVNELTVQDTGDTEIKNYLKISEARPFVVNDKAYLIPKKSVFNKIVGDSNFELEFAGFLEGCDDVISFAKNFENKEATALRVEYKNSEGSIANYYPDFFVKKDEKTVYIIETKGREEDDDKLKFQRLQKWCEDVNARQSRVVYKSLYIKQDNWEKDKLKNFDEVVRVFGK